MGVCQCIACFNCESPKIFTRHKQVIWHQRLTIMFDFRETQSASKTYRNAEISVVLIGDSLAGYHPIYTSQKTTSVEFLMSVLNQSLGQPS